MKPQSLPEPGRRRRTPDRFSWVDQRLVREGYIERCTTYAMALYLVLVTVADRDGVSYYGDRRLCRMLRWTALELKGARRNLQHAGLVAYQFPFYQVLGLDPEQPVATAAPSGPAPPAKPRAEERPATPEEIRAITEAWVEEVYGR